MKVLRLDYVNPYQVFLFLRSCGYPVHLFLDSAFVNEKTGRFSFIAIGKEEELVLKSDVGAFEKLRAFVSKLREKYIIPELPFGVFGFISYDANVFIEPSVKSGQVDDIGYPDVYFFLPETLFIFDNVEKKAWCITFSKLLEIGLISKPEGTFSAKVSNFNMTKEYFVSAVEKIKGYIAAGDTFQVNFSQRIDVDFEGDFLTLYHVLRSINPSPFSFFLDLGDIKAVSCSPERLVLKKENFVETRPIAGTRPRGRSKEEEEKLQKELLLSEKERAEHIMLVDLERNDLGRVCKYGTVEVDELMVLEKYSHVIHIVSNVKGELKEGVDEVDVIKAMFPGGTITGAPKVRTMEIIAELEPTKRALYTGSVGYIGFNGVMDFNIVIRTLLFNGGRGFLQVGAGIVWDSDPVKEYEETLHKGEALLKALSSF
ncbi:aminodeoxychorismate synthase, subunit I [Desulfurobacterium pacificum]|uniref:Aminodeoxychorismate synthase, subunit I n=1 Tax=Desulfurobacterium pacificum TaxID=240166 RepID=A0ABY1N7J8_9BACT|nr:anthranilate synthase component I family protein [Desulfurobacterium pacificum]SMP02537.1 aminodeoxychorismate synthase, subunit I [Desulfurobacterium pacificum]